MEAIDDIDLYGIEELLGHGDDLRLLTNDWPGNDPLSNSNDMHAIDDYFNHDNSGSSSNEAYTPSTVDSGNHSPTTTSSSSSDIIYQQQYIWQEQYHQQPQDEYNVTTDEHGYQQQHIIPPQVDLEAIEQLLNDRNATYTYVSSPDSVESMSSPPGSNNNYIFQTTPVQQPQQQQLSPQQTFIIPSALRIKSSNNRSHPYPLILPKNVKPRQDSQQTSQDSEIQIISTTPTPQPQAIILNPNELHRIQTALTAQRQQQQSQPQTYYVPTSSISLTPVSLNAENLTSSSTPMPLSTPTPNMKSQEDMDFSRKCEDRKIRNRQAAQLSRERKKAEYDQMKDLISRYENENTELKKENLRLKQRITELEGYFVFPKESKKNIAKAVGVSLMVVMMFVSFPGAMKNFSPTTIETEPIHLRQIRSIPNISENAIAHVGSRALLAVEDYDPGEDNIIPSTSFQSDFKSSSSPLNSSNSTTAGSCPNHFLNATERIRVNNDLISWIDRHEKMNLVQLRSGKSPFLIYNSRNVLFPQEPIKQYPHVQVNSTDLVNISNSMRRSERRRHKETGHQKALRERAWRHLELINTPMGPKPYQEDKKIGGTELAVPINIQEQIMKQLAAQLKQKDDMLYVMALKDYFILPRTATNSTELKLSIVLPALSFNSSQPNHLTMMRIECSVISTSLFFLPDRLVSLFNGSSN
jgi:hypothetical protein